MDPYDSYVQAAAQFQEQRTASSTQSFPLQSFVPGSTPETGGINVTRTPWSPTPADTALPGLANALTGGNGLSTTEGKLGRDVGALFSNIQRSGPSMGASLPENGSAEGTGKGLLGTTGAIIGGVAGLASALPTAIASVFQTAQSSHFAQQEWDAAQSVGLASPSQFGATSSGSAVQRYNTAVRTIRTPGNSVYG